MILNKIKIHHSLAQPGMQAVFLNKIMDSLHLYILESQDPVLNLSFEETLLDSLEPGQNAMLLYVNTTCLVIGKNQNPWWEADMAVLRDTGVPIIRRTSGGGTVYHDPGNLNYSFIQDRRTFDKIRNLELLGSFFAPLLPDFSITGQGDLLCQGAKFSGNALCYRKNHALHHGTLLIDADQPTLRKLLAPPACRNFFVESSQVASRPMKTMNIRSLLNRGETPQVLEALADHLCAGTEASILCMGTRDMLARINPELPLRHASWEWLWGKTPRFRFNLGNLLVTVQNGYVTEIEGSRGQAKPTIPQRFEGFEDLENFGYKLHEPELGLNHTPGSEGGA